MSRFDFRGVLWPKWMQDRWLAAGGFPKGTSEAQVGQILYALAIARRPRIIVETGLLHGAGTTPWLAWAAQEIGALHMAVDLDLHACQEVTKLLNQQNWLLAKGQTVGTVVAHSNALDVATGFSPKSIDFLFIDDDHTTSHVQAEITAFVPKMRAGGIMLFHDVIGTGPDFEIWPTIRAYGGVRLANRAYNYPENAPAGGLGMIAIADDDRDGLYDITPRPIRLTASEVDMVLP
jgi:predicted O-methyltransferase YrrM